MMGWGCRGRVLVAGTACGGTYLIVIVVGGGGRHVVVIVVEWETEVTRDLCREYLELL